MCQKGICAWSVNKLSEVEHNDQIQTINVQLSNNDAKYLNTLWDFLKKSCRVYSQTTYQQIYMFLLQLS